MSDQPKRKSTAELLKAAVAAKKQAAHNQAGKPRPDPGKGKARPDAERLGGKSRKVH